MGKGEEGDGSPLIAIVDYNAGNLTSVSRAVRHLGYSCLVTKDAQAIRDAERIIFPGVGAAGSAMESLIFLGLEEAILWAFGKRTPILGICLGTQIIMGYSEENDVPCLGIIEGRVRPFPQDLASGKGCRLKVPHMGWNRIRRHSDHPVLAGTRDDDEFYFVHGFYPDPDDRSHVIGETEYGICFPSVLGTKNLVATQFHPEKSGRPGLTILRNFCEWQPAVT